MISTIQYYHTGGNNHGFEHFHPLSFQCAILCLCIDRFIGFSLSFYFVDISFTLFTNFTVLYYVLNKKLFVDIGGYAIANGEYWQLSIGKYFSSINNSTAVLLCLGAILQNVSSKVYSPLFSITDNCHYILPTTEYKTKLFFWVL